MQTILEKPTQTNRGAGLRFSPAAFTTSTLPASPERTRLTAPRAAATQVAEDTGTEQRNLIQALTSSKVYQEYERAFTEATGLPVALRPVETWQLPLHGKRHEGAWCALMAGKSRSCANCLQMQDELAQKAHHGSHTITCGAGLCESMVPVLLGERLVGYLQTGQVFPKPPTEPQFERTVKLMKERGVDATREEMRQAYFSTQSMPARQHESAVKLLTIFAQHLAILSNQILVRQENAEPPVITKAKKFIEEHQTEDISLSDVAKAVNTSSFYFCKMFRKITGINFTDYLARLRIERAKNLLLNPNLRVSEIAYEVGFQSLTHFNRVFKRILGQSPTDYRLQLGGA
ncbi:MAG TPA: helix-turn-helix domain-containing protein [Patescibacteria group bacterium]|nr:helix-turn-helix domain-containing protein [Patescibacteria group bacterium]